MNVIFEKEFVEKFVEEVSRAFGKYIHIDINCNNIRENACGFCSPQIYGVKIFGETEATIIADRLLKKSARQYKRLCKEMLNRVNHTTIHELIHRIEHNDSFCFSENLVNYTSFLMLLVSSTDIELDKKLLEMTKIRYEKIGRLLLEDLV